MTLFAVDVNPGLSESMWAGTHVSEEERFEAAHAFLKHYLAHWEVLETHKEAAVEK